MVVFRDGSVRALGDDEVRGVPGKGKVVAASSQGGRLALVVAQAHRKFVLTLYALQVSVVALQTSNPRKRECITKEGRVESKRLRSHEMGAWLQQRGAEQQPLASASIAAPDSGSVASLSLHGSLVSILWEQGTLTAHWLHEEPGSGHSLQERVRRRLAGEWEAPRTKPLSHLQSLSSGWPVQDGQRSLRQASSYRTVDWTTHPSPARGKARRLGVPQRGRW